jgi:hypothetical protein
LDRPDLVVHRHHRYEAHLVVEQLGQRSEIDHGVGIDRAHPGASTRGGDQHGVVLDRRDDHGTVAARSGDRQIVGLGSP